MAETTAEAAPRDADAPLQAAPVNSIDFGDVRDALRKGWEDFQALRGELLFLPLIYIAVGFAAGVFAFGGNIFRLLFPLVGGFALVGPIAASGFYELARRREQGEDSSWRHFFDPLAGPSRMPLLILSAMLLVLFLLWVTVADGIYHNTLGRLAPATPADFLGALFTTPEGWQMVLLGNLAGALFALLALVLSAFSFPMVVDRATDPGTAVLTSLAACRRNPATMTRWGILVGTILFAAAIPLFVGLMVALPVLGYATWHLYRRTVPR